MSLIRASAHQLPLVDGCVQCCVTSPPYWGLRDYGVPPLVWGDGWTGALGLEPTPDLYVAHLVEVFAEVRRVLKPDGVLWMNLGDSYAGSGPSGASYQSATTKRRAEMDTDGAFRISKTLKARGLTYAEKKPVPPAGLKSKDLVGVPWMAAFALRAAGWYLRSDVIWSKPNPMPESVTDRPTKAHEYLFLLAKSERYFYDSAAIAEAASEAMLTQMEQGYNGLGLKDYESVGVQNPSGVKSRIIANARRKAMRVTARRAGAMMREPSGNESKPYEEQSERGITRNKRSVWTVSTSPYHDAHFATFPPALVEPCILAGSRVGDLVLDPFIGSGTVGAVCDRLMRLWVGVDLNYQQLSKKRTRQRGLRFAEEASA